MTSLLVLTLLALIVVRNGIESGRGLACLAVLWCTVPGYLIYPTDTYFLMSDIFGPYGFQSLTPLLTIFVLSFIRSKLSSVLMALFFVLICANGYFFWVEGQGYQIQQVQQSVVWLVFFVEVLLMLSPRLTNGIHRAFSRDDMAGDCSTGSVDADNSHNRYEADVNEAEK